MVKRSRLRAQQVGRRRLVIIVLVGIVLAGSSWIINRWQPEIWQRLTGYLASEYGLESSPHENVRGTIYDRNYRVLAVSYERVSVYANIREITNLDSVIQPLSTVLDLSVRDLTELFSTGSLRIWLARDISQEQEELIKDLALRGVYLHREFIRHYPENESAAHLVGFVEQDTGLAGIEQFLSRLERKYRLDKRPIETLPLVAAGRPGVDGRHLILTIDLKIQRILETYLDSLAHLPSGSKRGVLVMEAASGALVGYAQTPSFDPNRFHTYPEELFDDVFDEMLAVPEPFKIFLREISLLESQPEDERAPLPWSIAAERRKLGVQLQLWEKLGAGNREPYDFRQSSSHVAERVSLDPPQTLLPDYETVPVMQTPLQLLTSITRSVNDGVGIRPHAAYRLVLRRNQSEYLLEELSPPGKRGVIDDELSAELRRLYRVMGTDGPVDSSLLSGTSTSYRMNGGMNSFQRHHVSLALVPVEQPELVVMVVGSDSGYLIEGKDADDPELDVQSLIAPVVALQRVMKNLADMMSPGDRTGINYRSVLDAEPSALELGAGSAAEQPRQQTVMPELVGMSLRKSLRILQGAGITVLVEGTGRVVDHQPAAGAALPPGAQVLLVLEQDRVDADFKDEPAAEPQ
ncbi:MAG: PASTA domain-containing protein [Desulfofustis sp.]|nr:PASTA domain-containing protein [Desulfofustis sp.]